MAQHVVVTLEDDLDGSEASKTIQFSVDGYVYSIDLNDANAAAFYDAIALYREKARLLQEPVKSRKRYT